MPGRLIPLATGETYHVFNRGIDHRPTFLDKREFEHIKNLINFYRFSETKIRYSLFATWAKERRDEFLGDLEDKGTKLVDILSHCIMPNHFHLLLKQEAEAGISKFLSNLQNSYTRYFNIRRKRTGPLFLDQFKAVRIETDDQLLHVSRYIHLNPYTSFVVKTLNALKNYSWSSLPEYLGSIQGFCSTKELLSHFRGLTNFEKFTFDQADYQRRLEGIKHLTFEQ